MKNKPQPSGIRKTPISKIEFLGNIGWWMYQMDEVFPTKNQWRTEFLKMLQEQLIRLK